MRCLFNMVIVMMRRVNIRLGWDIMYGLIRRIRIWLEVFRLLYGLSSVLSLVVGLMIVRRCMVLCWLLRVLVARRWLILRRRI